MAKPKKKPAAEPVRSISSPQKKAEIKHNHSNSVFNTQRFWLILAPIVAFLLYCNTLSNGYALDDLAVISQNKFVQKGFGGFGDIFTTYYWAGFWTNYSGLYRPLSLILFATEWAISPNNTVLFHLVNVLLYALSAFLLLRFLLKLFPAEKIIFPVIATLIFIFNPMHTEVVANIKSADEILYLIFFILSASWLLKSVESGKMSHKIISGVFLLLSLLSKEGAILFIPVLGLLLFMFRSVELKKIFSFLLPHLIFTALWLLLHYYIIEHGPAYKPYEWRDNSLLASDSFFIQKSTAIGFLGRYIIKSFLPYQMAWDYSYPAIPNTGLFSAWPMIGLILSLFLLFIAIKYFKKNPVISFSILFFFITIALTSNIFKTIGANIADRFLFVPSLGTALLISYCLSQIKIKNQALIVLLACPLFIFYSFKTVNRNNDWKNDFTLNQKDLATVANSARLHYNYGILLLNDVYPQEQNEERKSLMLQEIQEHLKKAIELVPKDMKPQDPAPWAAMGIAKYREKKYSEAIDAMKTGISLNPGDFSQYGNLADAFFMKKDYDSSIYYHKFCVEKNVIYRDTWNFLGTAYFEKKNYPEALKCFEKGVARDSLYAELWMNYANALAINKEFAKAIPCFQKAYDLDNGKVKALYFMALTYQNMGDSLNTQKFLDLYNEKNTKK
ncbi:MAG: tetratricopeptide repeat protein [Bacteroidia bacterium]|nr:tetratricopeptide repeat protein [Bacteroidia bacterium]